MAIGRRAVELQIASVLETGTTAPYALPGDMRKWNRDTTPTDVKETVFYEQGWIADPEYREQVWTGTKRISQARLALVLSTFVPEAIVEKGQGPGSVGQEEARRRLMDYWEKIRWRLTAEAHWNQGATGIVDVRDTGFGSGTEIVRQGRMIRPMAFLVVIDESV